jgi:DNA anti-recombination protein RmuC
MRAPIASGTAFRALGAAAVAALALSASACGGGGGGGGGSTTTAASGTATSSTVQWANGVCSALTAWNTSIENIKTSVKSGQPSKSELKSAAQQVSDATDELASSLKQLNTPDTQAGQTAKKSLDTLSTELSSSTDKIEEALKSSSSSAGGSLATLSTVSGELAAMAQNISQAVGRLRQVDVKGELDRAFHQAKSCSSFFAS